MGYESQAKEHKTFGQFKEVTSKENPGVNLVEEDLASDDDVEECIAEWVDTWKDKPIACSFLQPSPRKRDEMKFTFDVTQCDKLFDVLLQNKVIRLSGNHVVPSVAQLAEGKYCKWHGTFSHMTSECNYFHQQVQAVLKDGRLMLGDGHRMKLDTDPFPANVNTINFEDVKVLVRPEQPTQRGVRLSLCQTSPDLKC
jgi:hypothetical protein